MAVFVRGKTHGLFVVVLTASKPAASYHPRDTARFIDQITRQSNELTSSPALPSPARRQPAS
jgi:hypothetical protein